MANTSLHVLMSRPFLVTLGGIFGFALLTTLPSQNEVNKHLKKYDKVPLNFHEYKKNVGGPLSEAEFEEKMQQIRAIAKEARIDYDGIRIHTFSNLEKY